MNRFELLAPLSCETNTHHQSNEVFDRFLLDKDNAYLIMTFQTPFLILTEAGMERGKPGDSILHTPGYRTRHSATQDMNTGWTNDWMYFVSDAAAPLI